MATDATGTPTSKGIPKYDPANDAPSGLGFNATMDVIDTLLGWVKLRKNSGGADLERGRLNLIEGAGISLTVADDAVNNEVDVTITSTAVSKLDVISDTTLGAAAASVDITSIPATYAHLRLVISARGDTAAAAIVVTGRFNNDSGANYSQQVLTVAGSTSTAAEAIGATTLRLGRAPGANAPANSFGAVVVDIADYANTSRHKHTVGQSSSREGTTTGLFSMETAAGVWFATPAAINQITILPNAGNFDAGTRVTLYGLKV